MRILPHFILGNKSVYAFLMCIPFCAPLCGCGDWFNQPFINSVQDERFVFEQSNEIVRLMLQNPWLPLDIAEDLVKKQENIQENLVPLEKIMLKYNATGINDDDFSMKYVPHQAIIDNRTVKALIKEYQQEVHRTLKTFGNVGPAGLPLDMGVSWEKAQKHRKHKAVEPGWGRVIVQASPLMQDLLPRPWNEGVGTQARLQEEAAKHVEKGEDWGNAFPHKFNAPAQAPKKSSEAPNNSQSLSQQHGPQRGTGK